MFDKVQPAVKQETKRLAIAVAVGLVIMYAGFFVLHGFFPEKVPFDYTVILGGIGGGAVAVLNFFLLGITLQGAVGISDEDEIKTRVKASYRNRMLLQVVWVIVAILVPYVQVIAGLLPLLMPGVWFKIYGFTGK